MLAFIVQSRRLVAKKKPLPKLRKGWALIRVRLAGICNTDVEILRGYHNFHGTPGHELFGAWLQAGVRFLPPRLENALRAPHRSRHRRARRRLRRISRFAAGKSASRSR